MLSDYRTWLESELKLLANASHHAYSFGQANMAKRAIERLDQELTGKVPLLLTPAEASAAAAVLTEIHAAAPLPPALETLRQRLAEALTQEASAGT